MNIIEKRQYLANKYYIPSLRADDVVIEKLFKLHEFCKENDITIFGEHGNRVCIFERGAGAHPFAYAAFI